MNHKAKLSLHQDVLKVDGQINFDTVMPLYHESQQVMKMMNNIIIDLHQLEHCDSSGLALCTTWVREAEQNKKSLVFINIPAFMQDLIRVYGLDKVLPIQMVV